MWSEAIALGKDEGDRQHARCRPPSVIAAAAPRGLVAGENDSRRKHFLLPTQCGSMIVGAAQMRKPVQSKWFYPAVKSGKIE